MSDFPPAFAHPAASAPAADWARWCLDRLARYEEEAAGDPLMNSVRRLAYDLFRLISAEAVDIERLAATAKHFSDEGLKERAVAFAEAHRLAAPAPLDALVAEALAPYGNASFEEARKALEETRAGAVFTAHPTFAMSRALRAALAAIAEGANPAAIDNIAHAPDPAITLADEHADAQEAIARAQEAFRAINREILLWARARFPDRWPEIVPAPLSLATWVGYDLDGRTDIHWSQTFRLRLEEKAAQLRRYAARLRAVPGEEGAAARDRLAARLEAAAEFAGEQAAAFDGNFDDPAVVTRAANHLSKDDPRRLVSLGPVVAELGALIGTAPDDEARLELCLLRAEMAAYGLGVARIHLRINAAQVRSALRADLGLDPDRDFINRTALVAAAKKAASVASKRVNLASIFLEQMTARRQFMLCAQLLKHVDADTPIRFLIAECEAPATIMGAIYLARLYGVERRLDISPLFETPEALERGGRFLERLLDEEEFVSYIRARGRIAVQLGFSDSGRFMGQVAANLAIERLHILLARALAAHGVRDIEVVLFNTHGESMGRGGFPGDLGERFDYLITPWTRARYAREGLKVNAESSFQGGDGYLHFQTDALARSTVSALFAWAFRPVCADQNDRFYTDINYSWDLYRGVKAWQEALFDNADYQAAIGAFAPNMLVVSGSRRVRRQRGSGASTGPRSLRAIPHNAILQQLAAPANVCGGMGAAAGSEAERFVELARRSPRMRQAFEMVRCARALTSLPVMRAYAAMYDAGLWVGKAARAADAAEARAFETLAAHLAPLAVPVALNRLANRLALDLARLDRILHDLDGPGARKARHASRRPIHALHAIRQAMVMRAFTLIAALPAFSQRHDVSRASLLDLACELQFDSLAELLETIFPATRLDAAALKGVEEPGDDLGEAMRGYPEIHERTIAPLRRIHRAIREIGVGLSHFYGAYG